MPFIRFNRLIVVSFNLNENCAGAHTLATNIEWQKCQFWSCLSSMHFHMIPGCIGNRRREPSLILRFQLGPNYLLNRNHPHSARYTEHRIKWYCLNFRSVFAGTAFGRYRRSVSAAFIDEVKRRAEQWIGSSWCTAKPQYMKWQNQPRPLHQINIGQLFINCS